MPVVAHRIVTDTAKRFSKMASAASVTASTPRFHRGGPGSTPRAALQALRVAPIGHTTAKAILVRHHYMHSLPGGTKLTFGVFLGSRLLGALTFGVGPMNAHRLVEGATGDDCLTLTRLWLSDELPRNSESRVLGIVLRALQRHTSAKFLLTYADPAQGHAGTIYQATNWLYIGLSQAMPLYDLGDGRLQQSRSLAHAFGTHSVRYFKRHGVEIAVIPQAPKHRYVHFLDPSWRARLHILALPYPKTEATDAGR